VSTDIETDVAHYAKAAQAGAQRLGDEAWTIELADSFRITLISPALYRERYGACCVETDGRRSFFGSIVFEAPDLARIRDLASSVPEARVETAKSSISMLIPVLNSLLEFRSDR
jgi:hypothetical protein